ncbi:MAG: 6-bladed beta-propeller [Gammaproteobacteria bacterium]
MHNTWFNYFLVTLIVLILTGCAGTPESASKFEPPVYPPPPSQPRFVYERTLLYNDDVEETTSGMRFKQFATGASKKLRGLIKPFDVAVQDGRVYVTDTVQKAILLFDIPGKRFLEIGREKPGVLKKPLGIDIAVDGRIFVADITAQRIMVYNADGQYQYAIGTGQILKRPSDVAVSKSGTKIFVVDTGGVDTQSHHVQVFDANTGAHLQTIGKRGTSNNEFNLPLQVSVGPNDSIHVVDSGNFRVETFKSDGSFDFSFGTVGRLPGQFARPKGIATDSDGNIYVVDAAFGNVQIFNPQGNLLMFLGERGHAGYPGKFMLPAGIDVDESGRIYMVDQFFRKIDIFRPYEISDTRAKIQE